MFPDVLAQEMALGGLSLGGDASGLGSSNGGQLSDPLGLSANSLLSSPQLARAMAKANLSLGALGLDGNASGGETALAGLPGAASLPAGLVSKHAASSVRYAVSSAVSGVASRAISWAQKMSGRMDWNGLCEQFVEEAYGTRGVFPNAADAGRAIVTHRGKLSWQDAPAGALLYFTPDQTNGGDGHAAIYLGNGKMISATPTGVREDRLDAPYYADRFVGWADPSKMSGLAATEARPRRGPAGVPADPTPRTLPTLPLPSGHLTAPRGSSALPPRLPGSAR